MRPQRISLRGMYHFSGSQRPTRNSRVTKIARRVRPRIVPRARACPTHTRGWHVGQTVRMVRNPMLCTHDTTDLPDRLPASGSRCETIKTVAKRFGESGHTSVAEVVNA